MKRRKLTAERKARHARLGIGPTIVAKPAVVAYGATFEGDTTRTRGGFSDVGRGVYRRRIRGAE